MILLIIVKVSMFCCESVCFFEIYIDSINRFFNVLIIVYKMVNVKKIIKFVFCLIFDISIGFFVNGYIV